MTRPASKRARILVKGTALHFFDAGLGQRGSDKFYRAFVYEHPAGQWHAVMCWGRDGTYGQSKAEDFPTEYDANKVIQRKIAEKMRHGYEIIGNGDAVLDIASSIRLEMLGVEFMHAVAQRDPDKSRMSGGIIIQEEPDLMDLLG